MKKLLLLLFSVVLLVSCDTKGKVVLSVVSDPTATPKVVDEQQVEDGNISLSTSEVVLPALMIVDMAGKCKMEIVVDSKDQTWIEGKIKFPSEIEAKGSKIEFEYNQLMNVVKTKYQEEIDELTEKIEKIDALEKKSEHAKVALNTFLLQRISAERGKLNYIEKSVKNNSSREVSLVLVKNIFNKDKERQAKLFKSLKVMNKESSLYNLTKSVVEQAQ